MKKYKIWILSTLILTVSACKTSSSSHVQQHITSEEVKTPTNLQLKGVLYSALFQQRAAEYRALCLQAYNIAKLRLDEALNEKHDKPIAIVSDIDETFLDNSYYAVEMGKKGVLYDQATWYAWTGKGIAPPLEGSLDFFQYAAKKGVAIFYVTNRKENAEKKGTLENIKRYNYPLPDDSFLVMRTNDLSKESRRQAIAEKYDIVLLLGDSLTDFSSLFDGAKESSRNDAVKKLRDEFGKKFIIFPNTSYGDWVNAVYDYNRTLNQTQIDSTLYQSVKAEPTLKTIK